VPTDLEDGPVRLTIVFDSGPLAGRMEAVQELPLEIASE
jgi:hypothetical protein